MSLVFNMAGGASPKPVSLSIKTPPTKTTYTEGEKFSTSGMVVQVTYSNGVTATVTGYSYSPTGALTASNTAITISYTEGGVTVTAKQSITVKKAYNATFSSNSWADIAEACATNSVPSTWVVGNNKPMTINGVSYQIDIIGKNHDTYASGGTAPLTFQMHNSYNTEYRIGQEGVFWKNCEMRNTTLPNILSLMPMEVKSAIKQVNKQTYGGTKEPNILTNSEKLFLLSAVEVFGENDSYSSEGEGSQYAYYSAGNSKIKNYNGSAYGWWLRSPTKEYSSLACIVYSTGIVSIASYTNRYGVAFAFCF